MDQQTKEKLQRFYQVQTESDLARTKLELGNYLKHTPVDKLKPRLDDIKTNIELINSELEARTRDGHRINYK